jgi:uncharacterized membrane protein
VRQRAQIVVWVAVMLPVLFLPIVGLSMDAGAVFDARRETQNLADGAARTGGMEIDQQQLRRNNRVMLDPANAQAAAADYLARSGVAPADSAISASPTQVTVTVYRTVTPSFLRLLKVRPVRIQATGLAQPCAGVVQATCAGNP